jgi:hypothetical protein
MSFNKKEKRETKRINNSDEQNTDFCDKFYKSSDTIRILFNWINEVIENNIWYDNILTNEETIIIQNQIFKCTGILFDQQFEKLNYTLKYNKLQCFGSACLIVALKYVLFYDWSKATNYIYHMEYFTDYSSSQKELKEMEVNIVLTTDWTLLV